VPPTALVRDRLTLLTYGHLAVFGYFLYGFGPVVPLLREEQHTSRGVAGLHGTAFAVGTVVSGLVTPWLVGRLGRQMVAWIGLSGLATGIVGLWAAHALWATITLAAICATCGSLVVNVIIATIADHHGPAGPAAISEVNAVAAGFGLVSPLVIGAAVAIGLGWRPGMAVAAGMIVLLLVAARVLRVRIPAAQPVPKATTAGRLPRSYWVAWLCLVATTSVEMCLSLWVADVLRTHSHASPGVATAALSAIVAGMFAGRLAGGRLLLRWSAPRVLLGALTVSATGFAVFWLAEAPWLATLGLVIIGLGNALHFPLGISLAVARSGGQPDLAVSRGAFATGLAFGVAPFGLGVVADGVGPHTAVLLVPALLAVAAVIAWRLAQRPAGVSPDIESAAPAVLSVDLG